MKIRQFYDYPNEGVLQMLPEDDGNEAIWWSRAPSPFGDPGEPVDPQGCIHVIWLDPLTNREPRILLRKLNSLAKLDGYPCLIDVHRRDIVFMVFVFRNEYDSFVAFKPVMLILDDPDDEFPGFRIFIPNEPWVLAKFRGQRIEEVLNRKVDDLIAFLKTAAAST